MKILLWGWNGRRNLGDDLMTYCIARCIKQRDQATDIYVFGELSNLPTEIRELVREVPYYNILKYIPRIRLKIYSFIYPKYFANKMDLLIIGGGSIFSHRDSIAFYQKMAEAYIKRKKGSIISVSTSIGPFKDSGSDKAFKDLLLSLTKFSVRDERSYHYLEKNRYEKVQYDIAVANDIAFSLPTFLKFPSEENKNHIGIAITNGGFTEEKENLIIEGLKKVLRSHSAKTLKIFCFCMMSNAAVSDLPLARKYKKELTEFSDRVEIVPYHDNLQDFMAEVLACKYFFAVRLHSAIVRFSYRRNFYILPYHQKCYDLATDLGLPSTYILDELTEDSLLKVIDLPMEEYDNSNVVESSKSHFRFIEKYMKHTH